MTKPNRLFIKVHNGFPEHPKTVELSDRAFRHLVELWCFCSRNLNDGKLTNGQAAKHLSKKTREELVAVGFINETPTGIQMHDYLDHQQSAQQVADLRERRAEAGSKGGRAKATRLASVKGVAKQTPSKPLPDTDTDIDPDELASASSEVGSAVALPDAPRPDVEAICEHLAEQVEATGSKRPTITAKWRNEARLMIDRDGRTEEQIHSCIRWLFTSAHPDAVFWRPNVRAIPKLRAEYDRFRQLAERQQGTTRPGSRNAEWQEMQERQMARAVEREREMGLR